MPAFKRCIIELEIMGRFNFFPDRGTAGAQRLLTRYRA